MSFRNTGGTGSTHDTVTSHFGPTFGLQTTTTNYPALVGGLTVGGVVASGIDIPMSIFHMRPQVRYTRWNAPTRMVPLNADAVQVLMGISVGK
jgi:hypothetical protein